MPGGRPKNTSNGDRAEYLAQYLLSFIGLPLPVLRQLDIGIDFVCNISKEENNILTFSHPFNVQLKVLNEITGETSSSIKYGGFNKKGEAKTYEIDWLFSQGMPLFIGILDSKNRTILLYSISSIWFHIMKMKDPQQLN